MEPSCKRQIEWMALTFYSVPRKRSECMNKYHRVTLADTGGSRRCCSCGENSIRVKDEFSGAPAVQPHVWAGRKNINVNLQIRH